MKRELIIGIILAVVCGLSVKDVLDAPCCDAARGDCFLTGKIQWVEASSPDSW